MFNLNLCLNDVFYALCLIGLVLTLWYEWSPYTRNTIGSTLSVGSAAIVFVLGAIGISSGACTATLNETLLAGAFVWMLFDKMLRKAIIEPYGHLIRAHYRKLRARHTAVISVLGCFLYVAHAGFVGTFDKLTKG